MDVVYFELNDWWTGSTHPDAEPFNTWFGKDADKYFLNKDWIKANKLVVVMTMIDMSCNYCITAPKEWVEKYCPELLTHYVDYVYEPTNEEPIPIGNFGCPFLEYTNDNIGCYYGIESKDENGDFIYEIKPAEFFDSSNV